MVKCLISVYNYHPKLKKYTINCYRVSCCRYLLHYRRSEINWLLSSADIEKAGGTGRTESHQGEHFCPVSSSDSKKAENRHAFCLYWSQLYLMEDTFIEWEKFLGPTVQRHMKGDVSLKAKKI